MGYFITRHTNIIEKCFSKYRQLGRHKAAAAFPLPQLKLGNLKPLLWKGAALTHSEESLLDVVNIFHYNLLDLKNGLFRRRVLRIFPVGTVLMQPHFLQSLPSSPQSPQIWTCYPKLSLSLTSGTEEFWAVPASLKGAEAAALMVRKAAAQTHILWGNRELGWERF